MEGLTEFLPVSSTGHLILVSSLLGIDQSENHKSFEIIIQLGSICAVIALYFNRFFTGWRTLLKLAVAFLPTGIVGLLLYKHIKTLFAADTVAYMLIIGGVVLIVIELFFKPKNTTDQISFKTALMIGVAQCFAMIPGTSRSAATIVGGLLCKLDRRSAIEFSFMLAVPTMLIATGYDISKNISAFNGSDLTNLLIGFIAAFVVAMIAIKGFLRFIAQFNFIGFGIYRICVGALFLLIVY